MLKHLFHVHSIKHSCQLLPVRIWVIRIVLVNELKRAGEACSGTATLPHWRKINCGHNYITQIEENIFSWSLQLRGESHSETAWCGSRLQVLLLCCLQSCQPEAQIHQHNPGLKKFVFIYFNAFFFFKSLQINQYLWRIRSVFGLVDLGYSVAFLTLWTCIHACSMGQEFQILITYWNISEQTGPDSSERSFAIIQVKSVLEFPHTWELIFLCS